MKMSMRIDSDNAAFEEDSGAVEVARLVRQIADRIDQGEREGKLLDLNGNTVGEFLVTEEEE